MKRGSRARWAALGAAVRLAAAAARAAVPAPDKMAAQVTVSGRTSTAIKVDTAAAGQEIPRTFSGNKVKNTPGFSWWVSRHWALKTDYAEDKARLYLTLLEMAYPHMVEAFGREVPGIGGKRMAVCYASSERRLRDALAADGVSWDFSGGGITLEAPKCAYVFPGADTLLYHQRYIVMHECTHLYQLCLLGSVYTTPRWYYEGLADALASHVYEAGPPRLTVMVLDKATLRNFFDSGLAALRQTRATAETIHDTGGSDRGLAFLLFHYFSDDPDRAQRLRLWRDEIFRFNSANRTLTESSRLMRDIFGPWNQTNADFRAWTDARQSTFHFGEWGWEQDGDTLWAYGNAESGRLSETDVFLAPKEKPEYDPLRMDWPQGPMSPLVGPVARGTAEPAVGCLIDFSETPGDGRAGLGLGVIPAQAGEVIPRRQPNPDKPAATSGVKVISIGPGKASGAGTYLAILIEKEKDLVMDGSAVGTKSETVAIPEKVRSAILAGGHQVGMTVRIAPEALEVTLRARDPKASRAEEFQASWPLAAEVRERLVSRPLAVLSRDGRHGVTPYFDDGRRPEPDLPPVRQGGPANRWRNPGDGQLAGLYRAAWALGAKAPPSLIALRDKMAAAVDKGPAAQQEALAAHGAGVAQVIKDIEQCGAAKETAARAIAELTAAPSTAIIGKTPAR